jgi:hypothetical protein
MKFIITESKMTNVLHKLLNSVFEGFDGIYGDWAEFNCGMGVCCDPYAVGFTLPDKEYNEYMFKLVDGEKYDDDGDYPKKISDDLPEPCYERPDLKDPRFDTIVFYQDYADEIENYLGPSSVWENELLRLLNFEFGMDAKGIIFI